MQPRWQGLGLRFLSDMDWLVWYMMATGDSSRDVDTFQDGVCAIET